MSRFSSTAVHLTFEEYCQVEARSKNATVVVLPITSTATSNSQSHCHVHKLDNIFQAFHVPWQELQVQELIVWRRMRLVLCQRDSTSLALMRLVKRDRKCLTTFKSENGCQASILSVRSTRLRYLAEWMQTRRGSSSHSIRYRETNATHMESLSVVVLSSGRVQQLPTLELARTLSEAHVGPAVMWCRLSALRHSRWKCRVARLQSDVVKNKTTGFPDCLACTPTKKKKRDRTS